LDILLFRIGAIGGQIEHRHEPMLFEKTVYLLLRSDVALKNARGVHFLEAPRHEWLAGDGEDVIAILLEGPYEVGSNESSGPEHRNGSLEFSG
jgi:hypothetical protein